MTPPAVPALDERSLSDRLPPDLAPGAVDGADQPTGAARRAGPVNVGPALLLMGLGLLPISQAVVDARETSSGASTLDQLLYVAGLLMIFLPAAVGVLLPRLAGSSRVLLALAMTVLLQVARLVVEPTRFLQPDALVQLGGLRSLEQTGRLYADSPLQPLSSFYPGLQVVTDAVGDLTGLGAHASGVTVLLVARVATALAVLLVVGWVTRSAQVGAAAVVLLALDPRLPAVGTTFEGRSLALALAVLVVHLVLSRRRGAPLGLVLAVLATWAVVAADPVTAMLLVAALLVWAAVDAVLHRGRGAGVLAPVVVAVAGAAALAVSLANPGNDRAVLTDGIGGAGGTGGSVVDRTGSWEPYAVGTAWVLMLAALLLALWRARGLLRARNAPALVLLAAAVVTGVLTAAHLVSTGGGATDRATGLGYLGVAFVVAWWACAGRGGPSHERRAWILGVGASAVLLGAVVLGAGSVDRQLPGPFRVSDDSRSVDVDTLAAADWISTHLPRGSRVYADRVGGSLLGAIGDQVVVRRVGGDADATRLLLDPTFGPEDVRVVRESGIRYLVADRRNAEALPDSGVYVEPGEPGSEDRTEPVPLEALRKFSDVAGVDAIYDNGSIVVYDLEALDAG